MKHLLTIALAFGSLLSAAEPPKHEAIKTPPVLTDAQRATIWRATTRFQAADARVQTIEATKAKAELELSPASKERDAAQAAVNSLFTTLCGDGFTVGGGSTGEPECVAAKPADPKK